MFSSMLSTTLMHSVTYALVKCILLVAISKVIFRWLICGSFRYHYSCCIWLAKRIYWWLWFKSQSFLSCKAGRTHRLRICYIIIFVSLTVIRYVIRHFPLIDIRINLHHSSLGIHFSITWIKLSTNVRSSHWNWWPMSMMTISTHRSDIHLNRLLC